MNVVIGTVAAAVYKSGKVTKKMERVPPPFTRDEIAELGLGQLTASELDAAVGAFNGFAQIFGKTWLQAYFQGARAPALVPGGEVRLSSEHDEAKWVPIAQLSDVECPEWMRRAFEAFAGHRRRMVGC